MTENCPTAFSISGPMQLMAKDLFAFFGAPFEQLHAGQYSLTWQIFMESFSSGTKAQGALSQTLDHISHKGREHLVAAKTCGKPFYFRHYAGLASIFLLKSKEKPAFSMFRMK